MFATGVVASFHDESHLNAFLLRHMDIVHVIDSSHIYPEPPIDKNFNMEWLFNVQKLTPHIVHRAKNTDDLRKEI